MKNLINIFLLAVPFLFLTNCNDRQDGDEVQSVDPVKIDSIVVEKDTISVLTVLPIKTYSNYSSACEGFYGYDYQYSALLERKVVSYKFKTSATCGNVVARASQINFRPQEKGTFTFKFWNGKDSAGQNIWLEKNIVVQ